MNSWCVEHGFHLKSFQNRTMPSKHDDCYYFYYSTCQKGSSCPYRHSKAALGSELVCSDWTKYGHCIRGEACEHRHMKIDKDRAKMRCYWETQKDGCRKPHCPFMHLKPRDSVTGITVPQELTSDSEGTAVIKTEPDEIVSEHNISASARATTTAINVVASEQSTTDRLYVQQQQEAPYFLIPAATPAGKNSRYVVPPGKAHVVWVNPKLADQVTSDTPTSSEVVNVNAVDLNRSIIFPSVDYTESEQSGTQQHQQQQQQPSTDMEVQVTASATIRQTPSTTGVARHANQQHRHRPYGVTSVRSRLGVGTGHARHNRLQPAVPDLREQLSLKRLRTLAAGGSLGPPPPAVPVPIAASTSGAQPNLVPMHMPIHDNLNQPLSVHIASPTQQQQQPLQTTTAPAPVVVDRELEFVSRLYDAREVLDERKKYVQELLHSGMPSGRTRAPVKLKRSWK